MIIKIINIVKILINIYNHPFTKRRKIKSIINFFSYNISRYFNNKIDLIIPWVNNSKFIIEKSDIQLRWNVYCGMFEFEDMCFLLHALNKNNLFIDVGANVGSFSILSSKVVGAETLSFEPVPETIKKLRKNISINEVEKFVTILNKAVGSTSGKVKISNYIDTANVLNRIHLKNTNDDKNLIEVELTTLDQEISTKKNYLLKIDIEGFELEALRGSNKILSDDKLIALIIENNNLSNFYGIENDAVHKFLKKYNLFPVVYDPFTRLLKKKSNIIGGNSIYIKNFEKIQNIVLRSKKFKIRTAGDNALI